VKPGAPGASSATQRGWILQPLTRIRDGRAVVQLFGRLEGGAAFLVEDGRAEPYFFVRADRAAALDAEPGARVEPSPLLTLAGEPVVRVAVVLPGDVPPLRERLESRGVETFEADVRFAYRFLLDRGLRGGVEIEGEAREIRPGLLGFREPRLAPADVRVALRTLSLDLETSPDASRLFCAALAGCGVEEVHLVSQRPVPGACSHPDERTLLRALHARVRELDPDLLTGWNVVDFDLRVLERRGRELGAPLALGRVPGGVVFRQDRGYERQTRAELPGRIVLDALPLVRDALRLVDYRLDTVARHVLGRSKLLAPGAGDAALEIERLHREDPAALAAYNLEDARLVLEILEREGLLALALERSRLTGMQLDRVGASIACFDLVYLPELRARGCVAPSVRRERAAAPVLGGAVLEPRPGLFANVAVFDFKSLYPSLMRTFHLDPLAHARAGADALVAPNGARFDRRSAILPGVIERFLASRARARTRGERHADQAIKIMLNALFGVLAAPTCRFFDPEVANAITGFGQQTLRWTRDALVEEGVEVLYGDTDSVFARLDPALPPEGAREAALRLRASLEARIAERVRREYRVEPRLELELETVYERLFLPRVRGGAGGSKKRYAGWAAGRLELVGLESVRRDWPAVARRLQTGMLERLFRDEDVVPFLREVVARVCAGELDAELVYAKRLRKGAPEGYTATTPPHVQAARKAGAAPGSLVRYVVTRAGPEAVTAGGALPEGIDHGHYVEHVLRPVAESILSVLDRDFDEALDRPRQLPLL
jgi:DNA polymerase-2